MDAMISVPYLLLVWTLGHGVQQTEYSTQAACANARHVLIMAAVDTQGKPRRDFKAVCVTKNIVD
jgi:hypothetical protein